MSAEDSLIIDHTKIGNSILRRGYAKIYHQENAQLNKANKKVELIFDENSNYYKIGISYLQFDIEFKKVVGNLENDNTDVM